MRAMGRPSGTGGMSLDKRSQCIRWSPYVHEGAIRNGILITVTSVLLLMSIAASTGEDPAHVSGGGGGSPITPLARSSAIVRTVVVGPLPVAVIADARTGHVFVADYGSRGHNGDVTVLDAASGVRLRVTPLRARSRAPLHPYMLAVAGRAGRVFVADVEGGITVLDAVSGAVLRTVRAGAQASSMVVDERAGRVFVAAGGMGRISMLDATSGAVVRTIPVGDDGPGAVVADERNGAVYVGTRHRIEVLDARTGALLHGTGTGAVPAPAYLAIAPQAGQVVAIGGARLAHVYLADIRTGGARDLARIGLDPTGMAVDVRTRRAFVTDAAAFDMVDLDKGTLSRTPRIGAYPFVAPVVDERAGRVLVVSGPTTHADQLAGRTTIGVTALDAATGAVRRTIVVRPPPYPLEIGPPLIALAVDEQARRAFFTNALNNTVTVLDTAQL